MVDRLTVEKIKLVFAGLSLRGAVDEALESPAGVVLYTHLLTLPGSVALHVVASKGTSKARKEYFMQR